MKTKFTKKGRRILSAALCLLMMITALPMSAFAWTSEEGKSCTSSFGDYYVGSDGEYYRSKATYSFIVYDSKGNITVQSINAGNAKRKYLMTDNSGTHQVYCVESGVDFNTGNSYVSKSGKNSSYFQNLPTDAQFGIMMALMYGWHEGKSSPVAGTNVDDYAFATQTIIWEYQQQLRTSPSNRQSANGIDGDTYYYSLKGRPAEKCYNWILSQMSKHYTIPSFAARSQSNADTYTLKYNPDTKKYSLTLEDTNNTLSDIQFSASGISVTRSGNKYTFTSDKMITSPVTVSAQKNVNLDCGEMLIWGCVGKQTMVSGASDPVYFYLKIDTETYGTGQIKKTSEDGVVSGISFNISGNGVNKTVTTGADGTVDVQLMPGVYTVTEQSIDRYEPQSVQRVTIVSGHTAETKEQLDNDTEALLTTARKHLCQFAVLKYQQMDGLNTALPFGVRKINAMRTLTTESLAVFIPFRVQEIHHENGVYYGQNVISKNMIIANRRYLLNGNSFILGVSGAGKSFTAKEEMTNIILTDPNADVIIIDPEREYSPLVKAMQGEVIHISATSENHINAMDMNSDYGDGANPVILKSEFILSLCEQLIGGASLGAKQKSIIDRCTASVYRHYQQGNYQGVPPTLQDFREELLKQDEPEAKEIALAIELFTDGSLNTFAKHTNVDTHSRLICYDILDLGKQLQPIGMLVVLDSILNRITQNRAKGRNTFIFIDEIYLLFQHEYSANFLFTLWKRVRKYGAYCTGITQNVDDLLQSHTARTMLANSEFIIMLNQSSTDRIELGRLLNISDLQMSYITNVGAGQGLLKVGSSLVPFVNKFPRNTELYRLMTTKFGEV